MKSFRVQNRSCKLLSPVLQREGDFTKAKLTHFCQSKASAPKPIFTKGEAAVCPELETATVLRGSVKYLLVFYGGNFHHNQDLGSFHRGCPSVMIFGIGQPGPSSGTSTKQKAGPGSPLHPAITQKCFRRSPRHFTHSGGDMRER